MKLLNSILTAILFVSLFYYSAIAADNNLGHADSIVVKANSGKTVKLPVETVKQIKTKLQKLEKIEKAEPKVKLGEIKVIQDEEGRIFINDTAAVDLNIADEFKYTGEIKLNAKTQIFYKAKKEHESRFGWKYVLMPANLINKNDYNKGYWFITYDALKVKRWFLGVSANRWYYGLDTGYKIGNTKVILGGAVKYGEQIKAENVRFNFGIGYNF